jgi:GTPase SAR1 family protein
MAAQQILPRVPNVKFRVLIIGRANAGKTSILQRVCETTKSPEIYRVNSSGVRERVRFRLLVLVAPAISSSRQVRQLKVTTEVGLASIILCDDG